MNPPQMLRAFVALYLLVIFALASSLPQAAQSQQQPRPTPATIFNESYPFPAFLPYTIQEPETVDLPPIVSLTSTPTATPPVMPTNTATPSPTPTGTLLPTLTPTATETAVSSPPQGPAMTRFNFEVAGHYARDGYCTMHRTEGDLLLTWETEEGWQDSSNHPNADANGWIPVHIPFVSIYVHVFCNDGSGPIKMDIYNGVTHPDTGETVGWLTREVNNAIEIGWP